MTMAPGVRHAFTVDPEGCVHGLIVYEGTVLDGIGTILVRRS
jgi:hypothetical protein